MNLMFIFYALLIYIITNGIGKLFVNKDSKIYVLRSLIGFCVLMFGLQLFYYPLQLLQLSSNVVFIITSIIVLLGLFVGVKNLEKDDFFFLKKWEFYVLLILIFWIVKIIPATEAGDDWFYMPLIMDNADIDSINSINPRSGWDWDISELWKYQGYYLFSTFFYKIQSFLSTGVEAIFVSFRTTFSLIMIIYSSVIISYADTLFKNKKTIALNLIKWGSIVLVSFLDWSHLYWGSFAVLPTLFPMIIILLNEYSKKPSTKLVVLIAIVNGAMLSMFSSALFLNVFLIYAYFASNLWRTKINFKDYFWMLVPTLVYFSFFIGLPILILLIIVISLLILKFRFEFINNFINKYFKYVVIALPVVLSCLTLVLGMQFTWSYYRLGYTFLFFNLIVCALIIYCIWKQKTKLEPVIYAFLFFNLTFFNPLVCPVIAKFFTTDEVYYRLFYVTKNPIMLIFIFYFIYTLFDIKRIFSNLYKIGLSALCIYYSYVIVKSVNFEIGYSTNYNYILRENKDSLALGQYLNEQSDIKGSKVWSIYFEPRQYDISYKANVLRYPDAESTDNLMLKAMYSEEEIKQEDYIDFKNTLYREGIDLLITYNNKKVKDKLLFLSDVIYENNTFTLYKVNIKN